MKNKSTIKQIHTQEITCKQVDKKHKTKTFFLNSKNKSRKDISCNKKESVKNKTIALVADVFIETDEIRSKQHDVRLAVEDIDKKTLIANVGDKDGKVEQQIHTQEITCKQVDKKHKAKTFFLNCKNKNRKDSSCNKKEDVNNKTVAPVADVLVETDEIRSKQHEVRLAVENMVKKALTTKVGDKDGKNEQRVNRPKLLVNSKNTLNENEETTEKVKHLTDTIQENQNTHIFETDGVQKQEKKTSKTQAVLKYLQSGHTLSSNESFRLFNCTRLSAIIFGLKNNGHQIELIHETHRDSFYKYIAPPPENFIVSKKTITDSKKQTDSFPSTKELVVLEVGRILKRFGESLETHDLFINISIGHERKQRLTKSGVSFIHELGLLLENPETCDVDMLNFLHKHEIHSFDNISVVQEKIK